MFRTRKNPFNNINVYVDFDYDDMRDVNEDPFKVLYETYRAPLQVMLDSGDIEKRNFIEKWGFKKMRTCYSLEVSKEDMLYANHKNIDIKLAKECDEAYERLAKLYYNYYKKTHEAINLLTVDFDEFKEVLTDTVYYNDDGIDIDIAFVEENEIAYVYVSSLAKASSFYQSVLEKLFNEYEDIFFEADDVDESAMALKNFFKDDVVEITETWIYK